MKNTITLLESVPRTNAGRFYGLKFSLNRFFFFFFTLFTYINLKSEIVLVFSALAPH